MALVAMPSDKLGNRLILVCTKFSKYTQAYTRGGRFLAKSSRAFISFSSETVHLTNVVKLLLLFPSCKVLTFSPRPPPQSCQSFALRSLEFPKSRSLSRGGCHPGTPSPKGRFLTQLFQCCLLTPSIYISFYETTLLLSSSLSLCSALTLP